MVAADNRAAPPPVDAGDIVERLRRVKVFDDHPSNVPLGEDAAALILSLQGERDEARKTARNLQARLTARAKSMVRLRDALVQVHDHIEDEGDRVYFGSTNDADTLKEVWQDLDEWNWDDILADGELADVYEASRKAHGRAEAAEQESARLKEELAEARGNYKIAHARAAERDQECFRLEAELAEVLRISGERFDPDKPVIEQYEKGWLDCVEYIRQRACSFSHRQEASHG